jgi:hypothetical protein
MPLQSLNPPARLFPLFTVWKQQQGVSVLAGFMSPKPLAEHACHDICIWTPAARELIWQDTSQNSARPKRGLPPGHWPVQLTNSSNER